MVYCFKRSPVRWRWAVCLLMVLLGAGQLSAQMVDLNGDGMSDIWEWIYSPTGSLPPSADPDGDHFTNLQEAMAGSNPYNSNSYPNIDLVTVVGTNITITAPAQLGKNYILQTLGPTAFTEFLNRGSEVRIVSGTPIRYEHGHSGCGVDVAVVGDEAGHAAATAAELQIFIRDAYFGQRGLQICPTVGRRHSEAFGKDFGDRFDLLRRQDVERGLMLAFQAADFG